MASIAKALAVEAAKARFSKNFGSTQCESCEGLKVGPSVVATCFQMKQCYFDNFKASETSPRHLRVIDALLGDQKKT